MEDKKLLDCPLCGKQPYLIKLHGFLYDCEFNCKFISKVCELFYSDARKRFLFEVPIDKLSAIQLWNSQAIYFNEVNHA